MLLIYYYLYNPIDTDNFYILPWDYDVAFGADLDDPREGIELLPRWWFSVGNWWGNDFGYANLNSRALHLKDWLTVTLKFRHDTQVDGGSYGGDEYEYGDATLYQVYGDNGQKNQWLVVHHQQKRQGQYRPAKSQRRAHEATPDE